MPKLSCLVLQILVAMKKIKVQTFHRKMKKNKKINNSKRCTSRKKYAVIRYPNVSPPRGMPKDNNTRDITMFALWWCVCVFCVFAWVCVCTIVHICVCLCVLVFVWCLSSVKSAKREIVSCCCWSFVRFCIVCIHLTHSRGLRSSATRDLHHIRAFCLPVAGIFGDFGGVYELRICATCPHHHLVVTLW